MRKRVVIVGSKPNAVIPYGDIVYCVNGSVGLYADRVRTFNNVVLIATHSIVEYFRKNRNADNPHRDINEKTWNMIASLPRNIVLIGNRSIDTSVDALSADGSIASFRQLLKLERRRIVKAVSGCSDPLLTKDLMTIPLQFKWKYFKGLVRTSLIRIVKWDEESFSVFRPSTGVTAIVYAIHENGADAEYVVSGIGMRKRGTYTEGKKQDEGQSDSYAHIFADRKVLENLKRKYRIVTTEPELSDILPLRA